MSVLPTSPGWDLISQPKEGSNLVHTDPGFDSLLFILLFLS